MFIKKVIKLNIFHSNAKNTSNEKKFNKFLFYFITKRKLNNFRVKLEKKEKRQNYFAQPIY